MSYLFFFFFNDTATTEIYTLSLHDALPISKGRARGLEAATPLAREHAPDRDTARGERGAHAARLGAALLREVALGGALVQAEARRVAERAVGRRVAHDDDLAAGAQERPQRLVSGGQAWRRQGQRGEREGRHPARHGAAHTARTIFPNCLKASALTSTRPVRMSRRSPGRPCSRTGACSRAS